MMAPNAFFFFVRLMCIAVAATMFQRFLSNGNNEASVAWGILCLRDIALAVDGFMQSRIEAATNHPGT